MDLLQLRKALIGNTKVALPTGSLLCAACFPVTRTL